VRVVEASESAAVAKVGGVDPRLWSRPPWMRQHVEGEPPLIPNRSEDRDTLLDPCPRAAGISLRQSWPPSDRPLKVSRNHL
jgi:hypothetical protein